MIRVFGEGYLVNDPELVSYNTDKVLAKFTICGNEYHKDKNGESVKTASFFDCILYDSGAKTLATYAKKGSRVAFCGRPRQERWEDKEGKKRSRIVFRVDEFTLLNKLDNAEENAEPQQ